MPLLSRKGAPQQGNINVLVFTFTHAIVQYSKCESDTQPLIDDIPAVGNERGTRARVSVLSGY